MTLFVAVMKGLMEMLVKRNVIELLITQKEHANNILQNVSS
jgi:hypothetical protein